MDDSGDYDDTNPYNTTLDEAFVRWCTLAGCPLVPPSLMAMSEMQLLHVGQLELTQFAARAAELIWSLGVKIRETGTGLDEAWEVHELEWAGSEPAFDEASHDRISAAFTRRFRTINWADADQVLADMRSAGWLAMVNASELEWAYEFSTAGTQAVERTVRIGAEAAASVNSSSNAAPTGNGERTDGAPTHPKPVQASPRAADEEANWRNVPAGPAGLLAVDWQPSNLSGIEPAGIFHGFQGRTVLVDETGTPVDILLTTAELALCAEIGGRPALSTLDSGRPDVATDCYGRICITDLLGTVIGHLPITYTSDIAVQAFEDVDREPTVALANALAQAAVGENALLWVGDSLVTVVNQEELLPRLADDEYLLAQVQATVPGYPPNVFDVYDIYGRIESGAPLHALLGGLPAIEAWWTAE